MASPYDASLGSCPRKLRHHRDAEVALVGAHSLVSVVKTLCVACFAVVDDSTVGCSSAVIFSSIVSRTLTHRRANSAKHKQPAMGLLADDERRRGGDPPRSCCESRRPWASSGDDGDGASESAMTQVIEASAGGACAFGVVSYSTHGKYDIKNMILHCSITTTYVSIKCSSQLLTSAAGGLTREDGSTVTAVQ